MTLLRITFGGAIPGRWTARTAMQPMISRPDPRRDTKLFEDPISLLDGVNTANWPPPWQGARGTCSAFAVKAMEELNLATNGRDPIDLSVEFLYAKMREMPKALDGMELDEDAQVRLETTGGTFLHQARAAIITHGIASSRLTPPPYNPDLSAAAYRTSFDQSIIDDAKQRYSDTVAFEHDVATSDAAGCQREWLSGGTEAVSTIVAAQLKGGRPVAASFAILDEAEYVWLGDLAQATGEVRYPDREIAEGRAAIAGHAVCIVGFQPDSDAGPPAGWFVFRNSLGVEEFGADPKSSPRTAILPGPGYGMISAADVDCYCWEYLSRKVGGGGLAAE